MLGDGIFIIELQLPSLIIYAHGAQLIALCMLAIIDRTIRMVKRGGILIDVVLVHLPIVIARREVDKMSFGEVVPPTQFSMQHAHTSVRHRLAHHQPTIVGCTNDTIMIRCRHIAVVSTPHQHSVERNIIFLRRMERESCTGEEVVAMASTLIIIVLITIVGQKSLATTSPTPHLAMTIADVDVRIEQRRVVIDIVRGVDAATRVGTNLRRTIVARTTFFLEHDIDDASRTFGRKLSRRIVYHLDTLNALSRHLLEYLATII